MRENGSSREKVIRELRAARSGATDLPRAPSPALRALGGHLTTWAEATRRELAGTGDTRKEHEILGMTRQEYARLVRDRPYFYYGVKTDREIVKVAREYYATRRRESGLGVSGRGI